MFNETDNQVGLSNIVSHPDHGPMRSVHMTSYPKQVRRVSKVIVYWRFQNAAGLSGDVALLELDKPLDFSKNLHIFLKQ